MFEVASASYSDSADVTDRIEHINAIAAAIECVYLMFFLLFRPKGWVLISTVVVLSKSELPHHHVGVRQDACMSDEGNEGGKENLIEFFEVVRPQRNW